MFPHCPLMQRDLGNRGGRGASQSGGIPPTSPALPASWGAALWVRSPTAGEDGEARLGSMLSCCLLGCHHFPPAWLSGHLVVAGAAIVTLWSTSSGEVAQEPQNRAARREIPGQSSRSALYQAGFEGRRVMSWRKGRASVGESFGVFFLEV